MQGSIVFLAQETSGFTPYGPLHLAVCLLCFGLMAGAIAIGLLLRQDAPSERLWRWVLAAAIVVYFFWYMAFEARPGSFDIERSLPLHFCDFAWIPCVLALLTPSRTARVLAYYWGILLSGQAFIQPTLTFPPTEVYFWTFFGGHTLIVGAALYILIVGRCRPSLRDLGMALVWTIGVLAVLFVFNVIFGTNYGYVGESTPANRTIIDALGPWPLRVLWMVFVGSGLFFVAYLPWPIAARLRGQMRGD